MTKALFLDRDGVINVDRGYVHRIEDVEFMPGIFDLCLAFQRQGYRLFVVTNQSAVARGMCTEADVQALHVRLTERFADRGIAVEKFYYCPHHPQKGQGDYRVQCECRKPAPGMLWAAQREYALDLGGSVLIGDKESDIDAGIAGGVRTTVLINGIYAPPVSRADLRVDTLDEAVRRCLPD